MSIIFLIIVCGFIGLLIYSLFHSSWQQNDSKVMLLGIELTLVGGVVVLSNRYSLLGIEYLLVLFGLVVTIFGFNRR